MYEISGQCIFVLLSVQGKENGPRIHNGKGTNNNIMPSGNVKENFLHEASCHLPAEDLYQ